MSRCPACPAPIGFVCLAQSTGHARYCEWAAKGGEHRQFVADGAVPEGDAPAMPEAPRTIPLAAYNARRLLVLECDYRGPQSQCGCNETHVCLAGKGKGPAGVPGPDVTLADCLNCVGG